jgi:hypothetical protein
MVHEQRTPVTSTNQKVSQMQCERVAMDLISTSVVSEVETSKDKTWAAKDDVRSDQAPAD